MPKRIYRRKRSKGLVDPISAAGTETKSVAAGHDPMSVVDSSRKSKPQGFENPIIARDDFEVPVFHVEEEDEPVQP